MVKTKIIQFNPYDHYDTIKSWFNHYEWTYPDLDQIPEESYIVTNDDVPVCFSCFAKTDTSCAVMGFTIANPDKIENRSETIDFLIAFIMNRIKECGFKYLQYYTDNKAMVNRMVRHGMQVTDNANAYILLKNINGSNHVFYDE